MKKISFLIFILFLVLSFSFAADNNLQKPVKKKLILLISEQNIGTAQRSWWASEVDLSATETRLAQKLLEAGFQIIEPTLLAGVIKNDPGFRLVDITEAKSVKLGNLSKSDFVVLGKAVASVGGNLPGSSMRSCFANISVKLIRVKTKEVIAYLDATGKSAHMDLVTGGREALARAGEDLGVKIIEVIGKQGGS